MKDIPTPERDYLAAVTKTAQYLAGLSSMQDILADFGKVMHNFFGTDLVAFIEHRPKEPTSEGMSVHYCHATADDAACTNLGQLAKLVKQVTESGFLVSEQVDLPNSYVIALLPITPSSHTLITMLVGHKGNITLSKQLLNIYLAVAGLFESTLARLLSEQRLRSMADNVPEMLYQMLQFPHDDIRYSYVSKGAESVLGLTPDELLRDAGLFVAGLHVEDRAAYAQALADSAQQSERLYQTFRWLPPGAQEVKYILLNTKPSAQGDNNIIWDGAIQDVTERIHAEEKLRRVNRALKTLSSCNMALMHAEREDQLLTEISRIIVNTGGYHLVQAGLYAADNNQSFGLLIEARPDEHLLIKENHTPEPATLSAHMNDTARQSRQPYIIQHIQGDTLCAQYCAEAQRLGVAAGASFPLQSEDQLFGMLTIYATEPNAFDKEELKLLEELASDLAFGINWLRVSAARERLEEERKQYLLQLENSMEATIQAMATTIEMRDPYTAGHQRRVADLARHICQELGLSQDECTGIYLAATIHDIGKIQVPAEILSYPGKLSALQFALVQTHSAAGYEILRGIKFPWPVADYVYQHHERLDGSGYPQGLSQNEILLGARIIGVADVVEAIAMYRPYRPALGIDDALTEIRQYSGTHFDPVVVDACLRLFQDQGYTLPLMEAPRHVGGAD